MTDAVLRPIETVYRGYRFRSRLEARWAVFFDAAEIQWEYELEGFSLNGRRYLPDFWLPQMGSFVEVKPTEEVADQSIPLMKELVAKTGKQGLLLAGSPNLHHEPHKIIKIRDGSAYPSWGENWQQCLFCNRILVGYGIPDCNCTSAAKVFDRSKQRFRRIDHALLEAQQARFEHGEDGRPQPYHHDESVLPLVKVYVAGAVLEEEETEHEEFYDGKTEIVKSYDCKMLRWRCDIFGETDALKFNTHEHRRDGRWQHLRDGRFRYAGPTILEEHGLAAEGLAKDCIHEVRKTDAVFVWLDRTDTYGTLIETGAAYALSKPLFVAFASDELATQLYFARQLATVAIVAPDAVTAWRAFKNWQNQ